MAEKKIYILGIASPEITNKQQALLKRCSHLFTADRFRSLAPAGVEIHPITPLTKQLKAIGELLKNDNIAVFASGDPLYYGIVRTLLRHFSAEQLHISPALSSIQRAAALFSIPWDDARLLSLHGRKTLHLPGLFLRHNKNLALTDSTYSPDFICSEILHYFQQIEENDEAREWQAFVAEDIGADSQKIFCGTLEQCAARRFSPLNVFALVRKTPFKETDFSFGLSEQDIQHSRGLITKKEVRAATLHALRLPGKQGVFWDVGAGSGSISIEAARLNPELTIYAIEHKEEEIANIKANIRRFRCYNIIPVAGHAPEALAALPDPDSIFVGGSSGMLAEITAIAKERLPANTSNGRLVINGVGITKTVETAKKTLTAHDFLWESSEVGVTRISSIGEKQKFNPITIFAGWKKNT